MKVLIIDTIHGSFQSMMEAAGFSCTTLKEGERSRTNILLELKDHDALVLRSGIVVDKDLLSENPQLKFIGRIGAGLEHIDLDAAERAGVAVISSPEGNRQAVAEHALGSLLALMNNIVKADGEVRRGIWNRKENEGDELEGKVVAVIGYGNTGSAFIKLLGGFDVVRIAYDKYLRAYGGPLLRECSMEEVFREADVVSIHVPYNPETHMLVKAEWLARFSKPIYIINTSRGGILNTHDLLEALNRKQVLGACLDVLEYESETLSMPPRESLPGSVQGLFEHPRVLLTPHIAGLTAQSYAKLSRILAEKIIAQFKPS